MRISDWSSDVCSSDLHADGAEIVPHLAIDAGEGRVGGGVADEPEILELVERVREDIIVEVLMIGADRKGGRALRLAEGQVDRLAGFLAERRGAEFIGVRGERSEEHTSELQSLMRISYAVFCLKKKNTK